MQTNTKNPSVLAQLRCLTPKRRIQAHEHRRLAELQANRLRRHLNVRDPLLTTETIQQLPFLEIRHDADLHTSGMSFWNGKKWIVLLNPNEPEARQRFTLLHELHHIICHPDRERLFGSTSTHSPEVERMADAFAAYALMPKLYVKRLYGQGDRTASTLAERFEVSHTAMTYRLDDLALAIPGRRCGFSRHTLSKHMGVAA